MVRVEKRKWPEPGGPDPYVAVWWQAREIGTDEYGTWLYCPEGEPHHAGTVVVPMPCPGVQLMPADGMWAAWWWAETRTVTVDVCTRPARHGTTWSYVDLEVDLVLPPDGPVLVVDEEEFAVVVRERAVPAATVRAVAAETARLRTLLGPPPGPVVAVGWARLAGATG